MARSLRCSKSRQHLKQYLSPNKNHCRQNSLPSLPIVVDSCHGVEEGGDSEEAGEDGAVDAGGVELDRAVAGLHHLVTQPEGGDDQDLHDIQA